MTMEGKSSYSRAKIPAIARELLPDERVVWWAQPPAMRAVMKTIPVFLFGIPWTANVGAFFYSLAQSSQPNKLNPAVWVFIIGLLPFVPPSPRIHSCNSFQIRPTKRSTPILGMNPLTVKSIIEHFVFTLAEEKSILMPMTFF